MLEPQRPQLLEPTHTIDELFQICFRGDEDDEEAWGAVRKLQGIGSQEVFQLAESYARSETPKHRSRALNVMSQFGLRRPPTESPYFLQMVTLALDALEDPEPAVVSSAAWALSKFQNGPALAALIGLRKHADPDVRWAVAFGIAGSDHPESITTLIELSKDTDDEVRNWATFGLGAYPQAGPGRPVYPDTPEIRDALRSRLDDPFVDVRDEAIWGLALRKDPQGLRILLERLDSPDSVRGDTDTAEEILHANSDTPFQELVDGIRSLVARL